uniref:Uncharacterized protein n=1 Tax=Amphimedon queenslandica TaxID=400682 RepID=A0A1X7VEA8_AMPQE
MATHGKMSAFDLAKETWTIYMERLQFYFLANGITEEDKMKAVLLTVCGAPSYQLVRGLLQQQTPLNASFDEEQDRLTYEVAIKTAQTMELASQNAQDMSKQLS